LAYITLFFEINLLELLNSKNILSQMYSEIMKGKFRIHLKNLQIYYILQNQFIVSFFPISFLPFSISIG